MNWTEFNKEKLPKPLSHQSGGWFWIYQDGGIHGKSISPAWWSGEKFINYNMDIITHFKKMDFPEKPE